MNKEIINFLYEHGMSGEQFGFKVNTEDDNKIEVYIDNGTYHIATLYVDKIQKTIDSIK